MESRHSPGSTRLAAADRANGPVDGALVSVEADRVLFFSPASEARTRCDHVRRLVDNVSTRLASVPQEVTEAQPRVEKSALVGEGRRIFVVEDDADLREIACDVLADAGYYPLPAKSFSAVVAVLEGGPVHALVADIDLTGREEGAALVRLVDQRWPTIGLVVVTGRYADGTLSLPGRVVLLAKPY